LFEGGYSDQIFVLFEQLGGARFRIEGIDDDNYHILNQLLSSDSDAKDIHLTTSGVTTEREICIAGTQISGADLLRTLCFRCDNFFHWKCHLSHGDIRRLPAPLVGFANQAHMGASHYIPVMSSRAKFCLQKGIHNWIHP